MRFQADYTALLLLSARDPTLIEEQLVEIDLLRAGFCVFARPVLQLPPEKQTPYYVCTFRGAVPDGRELYPTPLREPPPNIAIPLRADDDDIGLPLQKMIAMAYERGSYDRKIDYAKPL